MKIIDCNHIGVSQSTKLYVKEISSNFGHYFEVRCGVALLGQTNYDETDKDFCDDPFSINFRDNFYVGIGRTEEIALERLKIEMENMSKILMEA